MERGLYAAASGMIAGQSIQDILAQNLANANTIGYKQDNTTFKAIQGLALRRLNNGAGRGPRIGELGVGVQTDQVYTDWQAGPIQKTGGPLDAALSARQFFTVQKPDGSIRYTKAGEFNLDGQGNLVTLQGFFVLDANNQRINVGNRRQVTLDNFGNLTSPTGAPNGLRQPFARLNIVEATPGALQKEGDNLFSPTNPAQIRAAPRPELRVGMIEQSNMNVVQGLIKMITISRAFETSQKALTTQDELLRQAATEVGRAR